MLLENPKENHVTQALATSYYTQLIVIDAQREVILLHLRHDCYRLGEN